MIKNLFLAAALVAASASCFAESKQAMTLFMTDGAQIVYYLDSEPLITFEGQTMVVRAGTDTDRISMLDVDRWEIGMAEFSQSGLSDGDDIFRVAVCGNKVSVWNPSGAEIRIFDMWGRIVGSSSLSDAAFTLSSGVYIIATPSHTYKIAVR